MSPFIKNRFSREGAHMPSICSEPPQPKAIPNTSLLAGPYEKVWKDFGRRTNKNKPIIFVDEEARETAAINAHDAALSRLAEAAEVAREEVALLAKAHAAAASNGRFLSGNASDLAIASSLADQLQHQQQQQRPMSAPAQPSRAATRSKIEPPRMQRPSSAAPSSARPSALACAPVAVSTSPATARADFRSGHVEAPSAAPSANGALPAPARVHFAELKKPRPFDDPYKASSVVMEERVKKALAMNLTRVVDLFAQMDKNRDGHVSRGEFTRGLIALGVCPLSLRPACDAVFDSWDADGSGELELLEIDAKLRRTAEFDPYEMNLAQEELQGPPVRPTVVLGLSEEQVQARYEVYRGQQLRQQQLFTQQRMFRQGPSSLPDGFRQGPSSLPEGSPAVAAPAPHREAPPRRDWDGLTAADVEEGPYRPLPPHATDHEGSERRQVGQHAPAATGRAAFAAQQNAWKQRRWDPPKNTPARKVWDAREVPAMGPARVWESREVPAMASTKLELELELTTQPRRAPPVPPPAATAPSPPPPRLSPPPKSTRSPTRSAASPRPTGAKPAPWSAPQVTTSFLETPDGSHYAAATTGRADDKKAASLRVARAGTPAAAGLRMQRNMEAMAKATLTMDRY